jgi:hypothetical protein
MKLIAIPILGALVGFFALLALMIIFNALTEPNYEVCATEADAGREWANTGRIRKNDAGQYLCPVKSSK